MCVVWAQTSSLIKWAVWYEHRSKWMSHASWAVRRASSCAPAALVAHSYTQRHRARSSSVTLVLWMPDNCPSPHSHSVFFLLSNSSTWRQQSGGFSKSTSRDFKLFSVEMSKLESSPQKLACNFKCLTHMTKRKKNIPVGILWYQNRVKNNSQRKSVWLGLFNEIKNIKSLEKLLSVIFWAFYLPESNLDDIADSRMWCLTCHCCLINFLNTSMCLEVFQDTTQNT